MGDKAGLYPELQFTFGGGPEGDIGTPAEVGAELGWLAGSFPNNEPVELRGSVAET